MVGLGGDGKGGESLTDAVLGLEDLIVVLCVLDLRPRLPLVPVVLAAGAAALTLRVLFHPGGPAEQREAGRGGAVILYEIQGSSDSMKEETKDETTGLEKRGAD